MSENESLKLENQKLRYCISLIQAELELSQRVFEIKQNMTHSPDLERIITPILDRISKIQLEKLPLEKELNLNNVN